MRVSDFRHKYMLALSDVTDHVIDGKMRMRHIAFTSRRLHPLLHYCGLGRFRVVRLSEDEKDIMRRYFDIVFGFNGRQAENGAEISAVLYSLIGKLGAVLIEADNYVYDKNSLLFCDPNLDVDFVAKNMDSDNASDFRADFYDAFKMTAEEFTVIYR